MGMNNVIKIRKYPSKRCGPRMDKPEGIVLRGRSQAQKDKYHMISINCRL